jgi:hypothetical protein
MHGNCSVRRHLCYERVVSGHVRAIQTWSVDGGGIIDAGDKWELLSGGSVELLVGT